EARGARLRRRVRDRAVLSPPVRRRPHEPRGIPAARRAARAVRPRRPRRDGARPCAGDGELEGDVAGREVVVTRRPRFGRASRTGRARRILRVLAVNVLVFVALLVVAHLSASLAIDGAVLYRRFFLPSDDRVELPNYTDKEKARVVLGEFHQLETRYAPFVGWRREPFAGEAVTIDDRGDRV